MVHRRGERTVTLRTVRLNRHLGVVDETCALWRINLACAVAEDDKPRAEVLDPTCPAPRATVASDNDSALRLRMNDSRAVRVVASSGP